MKTDFRLKPDALALLALAAALALLVVAGTTDVVGELRFGEPSAPAPTGGKPAPLVTPVRPNSKAILAPEKWRVPTNLLFSTYVGNYRARVAAEKAAAEAAARKAMAEDAARKAAEALAARKAAEAKAVLAAAATLKAGAASPPKPAFVVFTYRGMMRRPDATEWALIAAVPGGGTNFYREGGLCQGLMVTNIRYREVSLIVSNGAPTILKVGQHLKLPEEVCHVRP